MPQRVPTPLKWHGGKHYLAPKIVGLMQSCTHYVEPYFGGGSVLLARSPEGVSEVANDLNGGLTNFWQVLRSASGFREFKRRIEAMPFSEREWNGAYHRCTTLRPDAGSHIDRALDFFVHVRQSLAGRSDTFTSITRKRTRRGMNAECSAWLSAIEGLPEVHARLKRVLILNRPAVDVIQSEDTKNTLFYLDPPYLHETRSTTGEYGEHEMTTEDHETLLNLCVCLRGKFVLSGYRSDLYDEFAANWGWNRTDFDLPNNAASGTEKKRMIECVWRNF